jgi:pyroglutamyl-peptidase
MKKKILITAFGPFNNVDINPSQLVLEYLKDKIELEDTSSITYQILEVSYIAVDNFIDNLLENYDWIIHMGVASNNTIPRIEIVAKNLLNGKDIYGFEPNNHLIQDEKEDIQSNFPSQLIDNLLLQFKNELILSNDAGTYLCNYIYYKSLAHFSQESKVIFIHTADFNTREDAIGIDFHVKIILSLIRGIESIDKIKFI